MYAGDDLDEPDNMLVYTAHGGANLVCGGGAEGCCRGRPNVYLEGAFARADCDKPRVF